MNIGIRILNINIDITYIIRIIINKKEKQSFSNLSYPNKRKVWKTKIRIRNKNKIQSYKIDKNKLF